MKRITIGASKIAIILNKNPYENPCQLLRYLWKKYYTSSYNLFLIDHGYDNDPLETPEQVLQRSLQKHTHLAKLTEKYLNHIHQIKTPNDLNLKREVLLTKVNARIKDKNKQEEIAKAIRTLSCTQWGIINEDDIITRYEQQTGNKVLRIKNFYNYPIGDHGNLVCRIDGKINNDLIIEVKNRVSKLKDTIPDYEMIQMMVNMALTHTKNCHFIENYDNTLRITEIHFDEILWNEIVDKANQFFNWFKTLMDNQNQNLAIIEHIMSTDSYKNHLTSKLLFHGLKKN